MDGRVQDSTKCNMVILVQDSIKCHMDVLVHNSIKCHMDVMVQDSTKCHMDVMAQDSLLYICGCWLECILIMPKNVLDICFVL